MNSESQIPKAGLGSRWDEGTREEMLRQGFLAEVTRHQPLTSPGQTPPHIQQEADPHLCPSPHFPFSTEECLSFVPRRLAFADTAMPSRIPLRALCCVLLPWAFTTFHQALGNSGKSLAQPSPQPGHWERVQGMEG